MQILRAALVALCVTACRDEQAQPTAPVPPTPTQGVTASVTMDNLNAAVGQSVRVRVEVQVGTSTSYQVGSYTGRLRFDPARLEFRTENRINDGLRVANAGAAATGEIRFAGASPTGFQTLVLYDATFVVKSAAYTQNVQLLMEEISAASTLANLRPQLRVNNQVFAHRAGNQE